MNANDQRSLTEYRLNRSIRYIATDLSYAICCCQLELQLLWAMYIV